jgi:DNA polymerase III epsilon subunit-like protein
MALVTWQVEWINTVEGLAAIAQQMEAESIIALDTETAGWQTGNERLCLIQVGLPSQRRVAVIDPLAISSLQPLERPLSRSQPQVISHNASFEARQMERHGIKIRGVVDTLVMARKLRPDLPNHTLKTCVKHILGIEISKEEQTSDWSQRPLTQSQLNYAALDAEISFNLYQSLQAIEDKLTVDPSSQVSEMMQELAAVAREKLELTKGIAFKLAFIDARSEALREAIRNKLINGAEPYNGEFGSCSVMRAKRTEVDPALVKQLMPEIAPKVIAEFVDRKRLVDVMKEYNRAESELQNVLKIIGYTDRLKLSVNENGEVAGAEESEAA